MAGKEIPKGSFKDRKGRWFVACWECCLGINGDHLTKAKEKSCFNFHRG
jgi:hypothetical protein